MSVPRNICLMGMALIAGTAALAQTPVEPSLIPQAGSLVNLPSIDDCASANTSTLIIAVAIGLIGGVVGAGLIKLLESKMILRNDVGRLLVGATLAFGLAMGVDFAISRQDDVLQQCFSTIDLCRSMTFCGKAQTFRSGMLAGVPAAVVVVVVGVLRSVLGRRK
jgi:hypothetical protein